MGTAGVHTFGHGPRLRLLLGVAALAAPVSIQAQSAAQVLPPTREEVTRPVEQPAPPPGPRLDVEGELERSPCALDAGSSTPMQTSTRCRHLRTGMPAWRDVALNRVLWPPTLM